MLKYWFFSCLENILFSITISCWSSLLCFKNTVWPKRSLSMFRGIYILNTVCNILLIAFQYELSLGYLQNVWKYLVWPTLSPTYQILILRYFLVWGLTIISYYVFYTVLSPLFGIRWGLLKTPKPLLKSQLPACFSHFSLRYKVLTFLARRRALHSLQIDLDGIEQI